MTVRHLSQEQWSILGRIRRHVITTGRPVWTARTIRLNKWWEESAHDDLVGNGLVLPVELPGGRIGYRLTEAGCARADLNPDEALPFALNHPSPF